MADKQDGRAGEPHHGSELLYRSHIEIGRILDSLLNNKTTLLGESKGLGQPFMTRLLHVDPVRERFVVSAPEDAPAALQALKREPVNFVAHVDGSRVEFEVSAPASARHEGRPVLVYAFPAALARTQRREHPRIPVPHDLPLRCIADNAGITPFEAEVTDISLAGFGAIVFNADIRLQPGTILRGCRIVLPGHNPVIVDAEVRYTVPVVRADGSLAHRSGVRFLSGSAYLQPLIDKFIEALEADGK
jgi:c-di-GMP-binding flagellar brake protein YcgR